MFSTAFLRNTIVLDLLAKEVRQYKDKIFKIMYVFIILLAYIYNTNHLLVLKVKHTEENAIKAYCYILEEKLPVLYVIFLTITKIATLYKRGTQQMQLSHKTPL